MRQWGSRGEVRAKCGRRVEMMSLLQIRVAPGNSVVLLLLDGCSRYTIERELE